MIFRRTSAVFLYAKYIFMTKSSVLQTTKHVLQYTEDLVLRHPRCIPRWAFHACSVRKMWLKYTLVFLNFLSKFIFFLTPFRVSSWRMRRSLGYPAPELIRKCTKHPYQCNPTSLLLWNNKYLNSENNFDYPISVWKRVVFSSNSWRENFCDDFKWIEKFESVVNLYKNTLILYVK